MQQPGERIIVPIFIYLDRTDRGRRIRGNDVLETARPNGIQRATANRVREAADLISRTTRAVQPGRPTRRWGIG